MIEVSRWLALTESFSGLSLSRQIRKKNYRNFLCDFSFRLIKIMAAKDSKKSTNLQDAMFGEVINNPANASQTKPESSMRKQNLSLESFATSLPATIGTAGQDQGLLKPDKKDNKILDNKSRSLTSVSQLQNATEVHLNGNKTQISIPVFQPTVNSQKKFMTKPTNVISKIKRESNDITTGGNSNIDAPLVTTITHKSDTHHSSAAGSKSINGIAKKSPDHDVSSQIGKSCERVSEFGLREEKNTDVQTVNVACAKFEADQNIPKGAEAIPDQNNPASNVKEDTSFIEIIASKDSIVELTVDVILSSEDSSIQSGGIVAKIVAEKGGPLLDVYKDCLRKMCSSIPNWAFQPTPATGKFKCKHIFHAVVPQFPKQMQTKWVDGLESLLFDIFSRTESMGYESIALPVIGTGKNGAPIDFVIDLICASIDKFATKKTSVNVLKTVMLVHPDRRIVQTIEQSVKHLRKRPLKLKPKSLPKATQDNGKSYFLNVVDREKDTCPVCMEEIASSKLKRLSRCKHVFCTKCLEKCFIQTPTCPVCNLVYGKLTGNQPDGIMIECFQKDLHLPGYRDCGVIKIFYSFLDGKQSQGHPNPGKFYRGTKRTAYIPDNKEGQKVYRLLRQAFHQRLLFTIGSSRTTGKEDVVTWNDVHHKTRIDGGPESYLFHKVSLVDKLPPLASVKSTICGNVADTTCMRKCSSTQGYLQATLLIYEKQYC
ncbi:DTX [Mytilus coruscus]|uniref:E3 ubiquitin-protein ligase n=1 Tax=Mytilus coruscus TaxID=42192 RepID=A0A6J8BZD3_MYTCO|nr:DTX [Mytilus coruscus]